MGLVNGGARILVQGQGQDKILKTELVQFFFQYKNNQLNKTFY